MVGNWWWQCWNSNPVLPNTQLELFPHYFTFPVQCSTRLMRGVNCWVGQKVYKIKDAFSISPITSLIWILWVCWLSSAWFNIDCSQLMCQFDHCQLQPVHLTLEYHLMTNPQHETSQTTFDTFNQSQHLLHTLHKSLCFSCIFTFLEIVKHTMLKMLCVFFHLPQ